MKWANKIFQNQKKCCELLLEWTLYLEVVIYDIANEAWIFIMNNSIRVLF